MTEKIFSPLGFSIYWKQIISLAQKYFSLCDFGFVGWICGFVEDESGIGGGGPEISAINCVLWLQRADPSLPPSPQPAGNQLFVCHISKCNQCNEAFVQASNVKRRMKKKHNVLWFEPRGFGRLWEPSFYVSSSDN